MQYSYAIRWLLGLRSLVEREKKSSTRRELGCISLSSQHKRLYAEPSYFNGRDCSATAGPIVLSTAPLAASAFTNIATCAAKIVRRLSSTDEWQPAY